MEVHRKDGDIENRPVSKGGKLFDLLTYGGFAGIATFFATISIANLFKPGNRLHGVDQSMRQGLQKMGVGKSLANKSIDVTNLMWGGNLMLIPVSIMEYFRTPIVQAFNRMLKDPTDPKSIEDAPPQTFMSIAKGRILAWLTVFAGFAVAEKAMGSERYESTLDRAGKKWADLRGRTPGTSGYQKSYDFGHTGALDILATASSATMLYIGSHFFSKRAYERRVTKDFMEQKRAGTLEPTTADAPAVTENTPVVDTPKPLVSNAQHQQALAAASEQPQLHA